LSRTCDSDGSRSLRRGLASNAPRRRPWLGDFGRSEIDLVCAATEGPRELLEPGARWNDLPGLIARDLSLVAPDPIGEFLLGESGTDSVHSDRHWLHHLMTIGPSECRVKVSSQYHSGTLADVLGTTLDIATGRATEPDPDFVLRADDSDVALRLRMVSPAAGMSAAEALQAVAINLDQLFRGAGVDVVRSPWGTLWGEGKQNPEKPDAEAPRTRLDPARATPPAASDETAPLSDSAELRKEWDAFRADLRPALLRLAEVLESDTPEAQALRRALGEPSRPSSGRRKGR
jgi:hypothetical protein